MMLILDDDTPKPPDPFLDDLLSGQARRALLERQLQLDLGDPSQHPLPVVISQ